MPSQTWVETAAETFDQIADALDEIREETTDDDTRVELETLAAETREVAESYRPEE